MKKIFVYGLLRKGQSLNHYIVGGKFLGTGILNGYQMFCNYFFPMIKKGSKDEIVVGDVYEFSEAVYRKIISRLDKVEEQYDREDVVIVLNNKKIIAETYIYKHKIEIKEGEQQEASKYGYRIIKSGDWIRGD